MKPVFQHTWDLSPQDAIDLQQELRGKVITKDALDEIHSIAGVDVSYDAKRKIARATVAVLSYPGLQLVASYTAEQNVTFPYIPGLLSFREIPPLLLCLDALQTPPQIFLCDGHGLAHPRQFGLACHLGLIFDLPSIGVAKRLLIGKHEAVPSEKGSWQSIRDQGQVIGAALRTKAGANPVFVSIGHRLSLETSIRIVLNCTPRYRLPETSRWAHRLSKVSQ